MPGSLQSITRHDRCRVFGQINAARKLYIHSIAHRRRLSNVTGCTGELSKQSEEKNGARHRHEKRKNSQKHLPKLVDDGGGHQWSFHRDKLLIRSTGHSGILHSHLGKTTINIRKLQLCLISLCQLCLHRLIVITTILLSKKFSHLRTHIGTKLSH